ncbi:hypothetical protein OUZ56_030169 [Daphnia magna]|uniref:Uncharacterized protein n=1 Tax=Daphnia magna TaxID=35525 RepID=A0ABQ9ZQH8_9CRUS|nr:hypothetical protein OUZ56_030169 [Daphnia magna]
MIVKIVARKCTFAPNELQHRASYDWLQYKVLRWKKVFTPMLMLFLCSNLKALVD